MATAMETCCITQIGETAGAVWHCLADNGTMSMAKLVRNIDASRDTIMAAVGWLAREDKVTIDETTRGRMISLKW